MVENINKMVKFQTEKLLLDKNKKLSIDRRFLDLTKKSTQASSNVNCDIDYTQLSVQNIYGENKFKIQYEDIKREAQLQDLHKKRFSKFEIKIDRKKNLKRKFNDTYIELDDNLCNKRNRYLDNEIKSVIPLTIDPHVINVNSDVSKNFKKIRKDAFGIPIIKNEIDNNSISRSKSQKKYKVTFLDLLQNKDDSNLKKYNNNVNNKKLIKRDESLINGNFYLKNNIKQKKFIEVYKVQSYKNFNISIEENKKENCIKCGCLIL